jgi:hypothetical protein
MALCIFLQTLNPKHIMRNMPAEAILCPANSRGKKNQEFYDATG